MMSQCILLWCPRMLMIILYYVYYQTWLIGIYVWYQDPEGYVLRRWLSRPTNVGVVSLSFGLPFLTKVGWWEIKVLANGQEEVKKVKVEKWFTPRFEVSYVGELIHRMRKARVWKLYDWVPRVWKLCDWVQEESVLHHHHTEKMNFLIENATWEMDLENIDVE